MKIVLFALLGTLVIFLACNKDNFETTPSIKIKSFNTDVVGPDETLRVILEITDKEGDVKDSVFVMRERLNRRAPSPKILTPTLKYKIPDYPDNTKVEMQIDIPRATGLSLNASAIDIPGDPTHKEPDTLNLKFFVRDNGKNISDTVSKQVIVIR